MRGRTRCNRGAAHCRAVDAGQACRPPRPGRRAAIIRGERRRGAPCGGSARRALLGTIASALALRTDALYSTAAALDLLAFAEWRDRSIRLSAAGHVFAQSDDDARRCLFREHVVRSCRSPSIST
nr:AAA-associated domain-containing protein [Burkholderia diffusa]